jgi:hypothetical protein
VVGVRCGIGEGGLLWVGGWGVGEEEEEFRAWWGRLGSEEVEWALDGMKRMLVLDLCVLAVVGRGERRAKRGRRAKRVAEAEGLGALVGWLRRSDGCYDYTLATSEASRGSGRGGCVSGVVKKERRLL